MLLLRARACLVLVGVLLAVQAVLSFFFGVAGAERIYLAMGLSPEAIRGGEWWRLITHGLVHASWAHVGMNGLFLWVIGSRIEHIGGPWWVLRAVGCGVVAGGVLHSGLGSGLLVGVSGGCMALLVLHATLSPDSRMAPLPLSARNLSLGLMLAALLLAVINPARGIPIVSVPGVWLDRQGFGSWFRIGHACHFGGGLAGWLLGRWVLRPRISLRQLRRERARREGTDS